MTGAYPTYLIKVKVKHPFVRFQIRISRKGSSHFQVGLLPIQDPSIVELQIEMNMLLAPGHGLEVRPNWKTERGLFELPPEHKVLEIGK